MKGDRQDWLDHAESYPFAQPLYDYDFVAGEMQTRAASLSGKHAVLAIGSNAAPAQLARKFGHRSCPIPVTRVIIRHAAAVYSAHFARYGSIPATLMSVQDGLLGAFVTWLNAGDLHKMHASEGIGMRYEFVNGLELKAFNEDGRPVSIDGYYKSRRGPLIVAGRPVRLAEIAAWDSGLPALTQRAVLRIAHRHLGQLLGHGQSYVDFMRRIINDEGFRHEQSSHLPSSSPPGALRQERSLD